MGKLYSGSSWYNAIGGAKNVKVYSGSDGYTVIARFDTTYIKEWGRISMSNFMEALKQKTYYEKIKNLSRSFDLSQSI